MRKKLTVGIEVFMLILLFLNLAYAQTASLIPEKEKISIGEEISVSVYAEEFNYLYGSDLEIRYNSSVLKFKRAEEKDFLCSELCFSNAGFLEISDGLTNLFITKLSDSNGSNGDGEIAKLYFEGISEGVSDISLTGNSIFYSYISGGDTEIINSVEYNSGEVKVYKEPEIPLCYLDIENNSIYSERKVTLLVNATKELDEIEYIDYSDKNPRWKRLCSNCDKYEKKKSFIGGNHEVMIRCTRGEEVWETGISFFNDYTAPKIRKTLPSRGFNNGSFYLEFEEKNPLSLFINYRDKFDEINISECELSKDKYLCYIDVNLSEYNKEKIEYWINLSDIAGNYDESRKMKLDVDTTPPDITNPLSFYYASGNYLFFNISIGEDNFDKALYYDDFESKPRWRNLCTRLKNGVCYKKIKLKQGEHNIDLRILDLAGNSANREINVSVG